MIPRLRPSAGSVSTSRKSIEPFDIQASSPAAIVSTGTKRGDDLHLTTTTKTNTTTTSTPSTSPCQVCQQNIHRYCCPRCRILYCSVACYRNHELECTEAFHQRRVSEILDLEAKTKAEAMTSILQRVHSHNGSDTSHPLSKDLSVKLFDETDDCCSDDVELSQEELRNVLEQLETTGNEHTPLGEFLEHQSPRVRAALAKALAHPTTEKNRWTPWWLPAYNERTSSDDDELSITTRTTPRPTTIDEAMLALPPFQSLVCRRRHTLPPPTLQYNLIEILYSTCYTLRLYHDLEEKDSYLTTAWQSPQEILRDTLLQACNVLATRDRLYSTMFEVLASCTQRTGNDGSQVDFTVVDLLEDVRLLCTAGYRSVIRSLGETKMIVGKKKRLEKKIEFYMSWVLAHREVLIGLAKEIADWVEEWMPGGRVTSGGVLRLPLPQPSSQIAAEASSFLVETSTKVRGLNSPSIR